MTRKAIQNTTAEDGFTLIELLVSLVIISILAAIALVSLLNALDRSKQRATMADLRTVSRAVEAYQVDVGRIPQGTLAVVSPLLVPYQISVVPQTDHWSNPMVYTASVTHYTLESYGKDGINGDNITIDTRTDFTLDIVISDGVFVASPD